MSTARDLIAASLRVGNLLATGEAPSAAAGADGLRLLQLLLSLWSLEDLLVWNDTESTQVLTASKASYTLGSGGDISLTTRPREVVHAYLRDTSGSSNVDYPLRILTEREYGEWPLKGETDTRPEAVWLQPTYPLATLYLLPIPTVANTLVLWTRDLLQSIASLDTVLSLPEGYELALQYALAVYLCTENARPVPADIAELARETKAVVKRGNIQPMVLRVDVPAGSRGGRGGYEWQRGY
jgi:hypothetical protein